MFLAVVLILAGLLGPTAAVMWRRGQWLQSAQWVRDNVSPPAVAATPVAGALVASAGLMLMWPPAVLLTFLSAAAMVFVLASAARRGTVSRLVPRLETGPADGWRDAATDVRSPARRRQSELF